MANTLSSFVEDADISGFIEDFPTISAADRRQLRIAKGMDQMFRKELGRTYTTASFTEILSVHRELSWQGQIQRPVSIIQLSEYPVTSFTSLEQITAFDATGAVSATSTFSKSEYYVDLNSGIVSLLGLLPESDVVRIELTGMNSSWSFPYGVASVQAKYIAGYASSAIPDDIKMAWLIEFSRYWKINRQNKWAEENIDGGQFGTISLIREKLSPETKGILKAAGRRPILSAQGAY